MSGITQGPTSLEATAKAVSVKDAGAQTMVAEVVRAGAAITIPEEMSIPTAVKILTDRMKYEEEATAFVAKFDCFPWDGAVALYNVLEKEYGWAQAIAVYNPKTGRKEPPVMIDVAIGPNETKQVPWCRMTLPTVDGWIECGVNMQNDLLVFQLAAECKRKDERTIKALIDKVRVEVKANSIYRGKAIKIRFIDDDGELIRLPEPIFLDVEKIDEGVLTYSDDVTSAVQTNLFTPIQHVQNLLANNIPFKRGVLLAGKYGTGKTLAAAVASKFAVQNGLTYVYCPRANELKYALAFAQRYQSPAAVVFCEDVDRVTSGERSVRMDDILNMLDGIDSKTANIMVVLTTNEVEAMNPAMLRPGRLDAVIEVTPPDAKAAEKLLRIYSKGLIKDETDLTAAGHALAGQIPAIIAEVIKRAKLAQMHYLKPGEQMHELTELAVLAAAKSMKSQSDLLERLIEAGKPKEADPMSWAMARVLSDYFAHEKYNGILSGDGRVYAPPRRREEQQKTAS